MANDFIKISRTDSAATHAPKILAAVSQVRTAYATLREIIEIAYHNFDTAPDPDDFSDFEELFGIPVGQGEAVFTLLNGTRGALAGEFQSANALDLISRVG